MIVREATAADAPALARIEVDTWHAAYADIVPAVALAALSYEEQERRFADTIGHPAAETIALVAEDTTGTVVGYALGGPARDDEGDYEGELYAIYLRQEHQGQGRGHQLLREIAERLAGSGRRSLIVWVLADNFPARCFYEAHGGRLLREQPIELGGATLLEVAYGWDDVADIRRAPAAIADTADLPDEPLTLPASYHPRRPLPTQEPVAGDEGPEPPPRPTGIPVAVGFDWSLAALLVTMLLVTAVRRGPTEQRTLAIALLALLVAPPAILLGEALRRGWSPARPLQVALSAVTAVGNGAGLLSDIIELVRGQLPRSTNLPALVADIWIIYGLTRPGTIAWFAGVTPAEARRRHTGPWLVGILVVSIASGVTATFITLR